MRCLQVYIQQEDPDECVANEGVGCHPIRLELNWIDVEHVVFVYEVLEEEEDHAEEGHEGGDGAVE
jgi:hypothetical protein